MTILIYILVSLVALVLLIGIVGLILPKERSLTKQVVYNAPVKQVFEVVTNNKDWKHRRDLKDLKITSEKDGLEVWEETSKDGSIIKFETSRKEPYNYYSFSMKSNIMYGHWEATFEEISTNKTLFTATEHITIQNPFIRTLSYLFFDINKLMQNYQDDIKHKLESSVI